MVCLSVRSGEGRVVTALGIFQGQFRRRLSRSWARQKNSRTPDEIKQAKQTGKGTLNLGISLGQ